MVQLFPLLSSAKVVWAEKLLLIMGPVLSLSGRDPLQSEEAALIHLLKDPTAWITIIVANLSAKKQQMYHSLSCLVIRMKLFFSTLPNPTCRSLQSKCKKEHDHLDEQNAI